MTRLILTTSDSGAGSLKQTGIADIVIPLGFRLVSGPLPSDAELAASLMPSATQHRWLWDIYRKHLGESGESEHGLIDLCEHCDTIELWIDPEPNAQLTLVWLLDYLRPHRSIASKLTLVQADAVIGNHQPEELMQVVVLLEQELGREAIKEMLPMQPGDVPVTYADVGDLMRDVGFRPQTPIAGGIREFVAWYRGHYKV